MTHLVLGDHAAGVLRPAFDHAPQLRADIVVFRDVLAVGPLDALDTPAAAASRAAYWGRLWPDYPDDLEAGLAEEEQRYAQVRDACSRGGRAAIWHGYHSSAQIWLQRLAATLEDVGGIVDEVDVTTDKALANGRLGHGEFNQIWKCPASGRLRRRLAHDRLHALAAEWRSNLSIPPGIRRLVHGAISHHTDDFYDALLLECISERGSQCDEVVAAVLAQCDEYLSDVFFRWRLRELVRSGALISMDHPDSLPLFKLSNV